MKNILVGVDFNDDTELLLAKTVELAKTYESTVWLLHVATPNPDFVGYEIGPQYIRDFRAGELKYEHTQLVKYTEHLKGMGIEAEGLLIQGATIDIIKEETEKLKIDLLIVGHHEHGFLYNAFFGSTSTGIIHHVSIPVLVIPLKNR